MMRHKQPCPICKSIDGCTYSHGYMRDFPLSAEDWRQIYNFLRYVELPFLHNIGLRSIERRDEMKKEDIDT